MHIFENIYQDHYQRVIKLCLGYVNGNQEIAKDLAQEVFIKVWQHLETFRNESSISTWIYRITVNTCLLELRSKKRTIDMSQFEQTQDDPNDINDKKEQQIERLHGCISKLSIDDKSIILLELEGLPQKEIAEITGLKHEAVRVRIHRIKEKLLKCIQHDNF